MICRTIGFSVEFLQVSPKSLVLQRWIFQTTICLEKFQPALNFKALTPRHTWEILIFVGIRSRRSAQEKNQPFPELLKKLASDQGDHEEGFVSQGFYVSLGLGFVIGFWGVFGTLLFKKSWRFAYFNFLDDARDWIYVMAAVHKAKLLALIQG